MITAPGLDRTAVERIVREIVLTSRGTPPSQAVTAARAEPKLVVSISARHCHLTDEHVEKLFGPARTRTSESSCLRQAETWAGAEFLQTFFTQE